MTVALPPCPACGLIIEGDGADPDRLIREAAEHVVRHLSEGVFVQMVVVRCGVECWEECEPEPEDVGERLRRDFVRGMGG